jgi:hypothetical protein
MYYIAREVNKKVVVQAIISNLEQRNENIEIKTRLVEG